MNEKTSEKIIIIGAGVSGLAAGIYGQLNGYQTEIYEKNPVPGGLCVTWKRDNFLIDGCIHWMTGTKEGTEMYQMWQDLNAFKDEDIIQPDNFGSIEYKGTVITLWCDLNKLERELIKISPEDKKLIKKTIYLVYKIQNMPLPTDIPLSEMSINRKLKFVFSVFPYLKMYVYTKKRKTADYFKKFKSPILRYALAKIVPGDGNLYTALYAFGTVALGNGGVIRGGSSALINNLVKKYKEAGGILHLNKPVERIVIENNQAVGLRFKNNEIVKADHIIAACDFAHIYELCERKYVDKQFKKRFERPNVYPTPSCIYISLRINLEEYKKLGITPVYQFVCDSFMAGKREYNSLPLRVYSYDESFIKDGDVLGTVLLHQSNLDYKYWRKLYKNQENYKEEKQRIATAVVNRLENRFPNLKDKIKVIDVCTPKTYNRYTNAYCGSYMPFAYTSKGSIYYSNGKIRGLKGLLIAGQWTVLPGGIPIAMMSGKFAIQRILKESHKWYKISKPVRFIYKKVNKNI